MKKDFIIEYEQVEAPDSEERIKRALEMLLTEKDLFEPTKLVKQKLPKS